MIAEFIPVSPQMLMDRIVSYELCCKGSWTIFFNLFLNHAHSAIVALTALPSLLDRLRARQVQPQRLLVSLKACAEA